MSKEHYQVVIVGAGMVGVSLALCLRGQLGESARILLVEGFPLAAENPQFQRQYSPSFDARSTALSYGSRLIYQQLGIWSSLTDHACPIDWIHVSEKGRFGSTLMSAVDYQWPALGYVVENAWLGNVLIQALHARALETLAPARVTGAGYEGEKVCIELDGAGHLLADLLVVADGAGSGLRDSLGIEVSQRHYGQQALVANIGHAKPHRGYAFERFTAQGSLAMLPLHDVAPASPRSALVWSLSSDEAEQLLATTDAEFLALLQERFGYRLGRLQAVGERGSYPLALIEAQEQARRGIVVMGNAAHSLHPVAGQGFNLALRDVARLGAVLREAQSEGAGVGDDAILQRYVGLQKGDQEITTRFSDQLPALFMQSGPALGLLRGVGLALLDISPGLKREFVRYTAGLATSAEYRHARP